MQVYWRVVLGVTGCVLLAAIAAVVFWPEGKPQQPQQAAKAKPQPAGEGAADVGDVLGGGQQPLALGSGTSEHSARHNDRRRA